MSNRKYETIACGLLTDQLANLKIISAKEQRSVPWLIREAINEWLKKKVQEENQGTK